MDGGGTIRDPAEWRVGMGSSFIFILYSLLRSRIAVQLRNIVEGADSRIYDVCDFQLMFEVVDIAGKHFIMTAGSFDSHQTGTA